MSVTPVAESERIQSLDVMRGLAVLGILAVNAAYFAAPWQTGINPLAPPLAVTEATLWSWFVMHVFFELKFITLFSMLFGASIFMLGGERSDKERGAVLRRRLSWLLVFGLIHATLIWYGDILVSYALTGFLVLLARSWRPRTLLIVGVLLFVLSIGLQSLFAVFLPFIPAGKLAEIEAQIWSLTPEELQRVVAAYQGGVVSATQENFGTWLQFLMSALVGLVLRTAGVMMIGMALFKMGFLSARSPSWVYLIMVALGALALALIGYQAWLNWLTGFDFAHMQGSGLFANLALSLFASLGYASLIALLVKGGASLVTAPLAAVGRMAFTNYIAQSLIMTTIFWGGRGFGLFGEVDRPTLWAIVLAVWAVQLIWSPLWLSRFSMGPLEWVWRRLSYGGPVSMGKAKPA
ncbi:MAG: DUF418 domain-containing protein [Hyphomonadaceae bacterium]|nr:DUF418 domain-containing protein [Hyphomonadaceae bacterium]